MITYAYWFLVIALIGAVVFFVGFRMDAWKATFVVSAIILLTGWGAYYFHFEQIFVKKMGWRDVGVSARWSASYSCDMEG